MGKQSSVHCNVVQLPYMPEYTVTPCFSKQKIRDIFLYKIEYIMYFWWVLIIIIFFMFILKDPKIRWPLFPKEQYL
jgi:hypothetical protein